MNFRPIRNQKSLFALALMLTISLMALTQLALINAQVSGATVTINNGATYTNSTSVNLTLSATNATQMCFSNDNSAWSNWENYSTAKNWTIPSAEGTETVYVQFRDSGNLTSTASASIILDVTPPVLDAYWTPYSADYKTVYFDASYSTDNNAIANSTWDLGDGNITYNYAYFTHIYASIGNYNVTLTLTDVAGNSASTTMNVTVPDVSTLATATPTPAVTNEPTSYPTQSATTQPTATTASNSLDATTLVVLVGAVGIIVVVVFVIILVLRKKPKSEKPQEQSPEPAQTQSPPPRQPPAQAPSGPSDSSFTI